MLNFIKFIVRIMSGLAVTWILYIFLFALYSEIMVAGIVSIFLMLCGMVGSVVVGVLLAFLVMWAWDQL